MAHRPNLALCLFFVKKILLEPSPSYMFMYVSSCSHTTVAELGGCNREGKALGFTVWLTPGLAQLRLGPWAGDPAARMELGSASRSGKQNGYRVIIVCHMMGCNLSRRLKEIPTIIQAKVCLP